MALYAIKFLGTAVFILGDEIIGLPEGAGFWIIIIDMGLSPIVLPVMGIYAETSIVLNIVEGALHGLVVEDVEIFVVIKIMNKFDLNILLRVSKAAIRPVFAVAAIIRVQRTEFGLVLVRLIELFHFIM